MAQESEVKKGVHWVSEPNEEVTLKVTESGPSNRQPTTVMKVFQATASKFPNKGALHVKRNGQWVSWTWQQFYDQTIQAAKSLIHLGVERLDGVGIIGFNSPEWFIADVAAIACGAIAAGIYTTNGPESCQYVAEHCGASVVFVENEMQLKKFLQIRDKLPKLKALVQWSGEVNEADGVMSWDSFMKLGDEKDAEELAKRTDELTPGRCCTLIYTSGTTGFPKAVMISHDNITWTAQTTAEYLAITERDSTISYLPLSHIAAQMLDIHAPVYTGYSVYFAKPDALKGSLPETLKEVKPTLFLGVPRVWEKIMEKMLAVGKTTTGLKKTIATWAKGVGSEGGHNDQKGLPRPWGWWLADRLVFTKVKEALGLQNVRFCATAAAPIGIDTLEYFLSLGIPIYEIYGMSECTGPQTISIPGKYRTGSCGTSMPGTELKIADPDKEGNGEICYRGRHIFMGYMHNPKATEETIDNEGWLHSGDVGKVDEKGFLTITGRIKELIITAGGENIPPVLIEDEIKKEVGDIVSNVMVVGDRKKFLSAVFTLKAEPLAEPKQGEYPFSNNLAPDARAVIGALGSESKTTEEAAKDPKVLQYIEKGLKKANDRAISQAQKVQKFIIIPQDFSIEGNELTPTMKLKRRVVADKYKDDIEKMYDTAE